LRATWALTPLFQLSPYQTICTVENNVVYGDVVMVIVYCRHGYGNHVLPRVVMVTVHGRHGNVTAYNDLTLHYIKVMLNSQATWALT